MRKFVLYTPKITKHYAWNLFSGRWCCATPWQSVSRFITELLLHAMRAELLKFLSKVLRDDLNDWQRYGVLVTNL